MEDIAIIHEAVLRLPTQLLSVEATTHSPDYQARALIQIIPMYQDDRHAMRLYGKRRVNTYHGPARKLHIDTRFDPLKRKLLAPACARPEARQVGDGEVADESAYGHDHDDNNLSASHRRQVMTSCDRRASMAIAKVSSFAFRGRSTSRRQVSNESGCVKPVLGLSWKERSCRGKRSQVQRLAFSGASCDFIFRHFCRRRHGQNRAG